MNETLDTPPETKSKPASWWDLILYLAAGLGLFFAAGILTTYLLWDKPAILSSIITYLLSILFLTGTVLLLGVRRGRVSLAGMGFVPPTWRWRWLWQALALSAALIPLRAILGVVVVLLTENGIENLAARQELILPSEGFSWITFAITLVGAGIIAPISEELYFRGLLHGWFQSRFRFWPRVLLSSALFGLAHFDSPAVVASSFMLGVANAITYERTKSLWFPIVMHVITNGTAVILLYVAMAIQEMFILP